ncbi:ras-related and estrogen-regulated growth inhibitor-like [Branchiostoma floridae x Branchiostoma japonicum]
MTSLVRHKSLKKSGGSSRYGGQARYGGSGTHIRVVVLGQGGVGKTAMTVRFVTRRFICDYDPTLEAIYKHNTYIDGEQVHFEILDTAGQEDLKSPNLEEKIRWGDAFIIAYCINDQCSFDEIMRFKFLINHTKGSSAHAPEVPVMVVGNKRDLELDRMVKTSEGEKIATALGCMFLEVSAKESHEEVRTMFEKLYKRCKACTALKLSPTAIRKVMDKVSMFSSGLGNHSRPLNRLPSFATDSMEI